MKFQSFLYVSHFFKCLKLISLIELNDEKLHKTAKYTTKFHLDISPDFMHRMLSFRTCFKDIISPKFKTMKEIAEMLLIEYFALTITYYPNVCIVFILYMKYQSWSRRAIVLQTKTNNKLLCT